MVEGGHGQLGRRITGTSGASWVRCLLVEILPGWRRADAACTGATTHVVHSRGKQARPHPRLNPGKQGLNWSDLVQDEARALQFKQDVRDRASAAVGLPPSYVKVSAIARARAPLSLRSVHPVLP